MPLTAVAFVALLALAAPRAQATSKILPFPNPLTALAAVPHLKYFGGPVMPYTENKQVLWGASVDAPSSDRLNTFFTAVAAAGSASPYDVDLQYGTQGIAPEGGASSPNLPLTNDSTYLGSTQISPSLTTCGTTVSPCTVTDAQVRAELKAQIAAGVLPAPHSAFGAPVTEYYVLFPDNVTVCLNGSCSGAVFCAYHDADTYAPTGTMFTYAVIPTKAVASSPGCGLNYGPSYLGNLTSYTSHEMIESITDPAVGLANDFRPPLAWYDPTNQEIGDICNGALPGNEVSLGIAGTDFIVQKQWSNIESTCTATTSLAVYQPPVAAFTFIPSSGTVSFDAGSSTTPNGDGSFTGYRWDFGDGSTGSGVSPSHTYAAAGSYQVSLIVTDNKNISSRRVATVVVAAPPPPPASPPPPSPPPTPPPTPMCAVPNVRGRLLAVAQTTLRAAHCSPGGVTRRFSAVVRSGRVISQSALAGAQLVNGARVNLVVSKGRAPFRPPLKVTLCYRHRTVHVTKAVAKRLRRHGATLGDCRKPAAH